MPFSALDLKVKFFLKYQSDVSFFQQYKIDITVTEIPLLFLNNQDRGLLYADGE